MFVPQYKQNPMLNAQGIQVAIDYPIVANAQELADLFPQYGATVVDGPAGGINPETGQPNFSVSSPMQPVVAKIPYLAFRNGAKCDAYNVAQWFDPKHGYNLFCAIKYATMEIEGVMAAFDNFKQRDS